VQGWEEGPKGQEWRGNGVEEGDDDVDEGDEEEGHRSCWSTVPNLTTQRHHSQALGILLCSYTVVTSAAKGIVCPCQSPETRCSALVCAICRIDLPVIRRFDWALPREALWVGCRGEALWVGCRLWVWFVAVIGASWL
jgi:hypothetical protein